MNILLGLTINILFPGIPNLSCDKANTLGLSSNCFDSGLRFLTSADINKGDAMMAHIPICTLS